MKEVKQTVLSERGNEGNWISVGNCLAACVASILDLDINDVPNFVSEDILGGENGKNSIYWKTALDRWLSGEDTRSHGILKDRYQIIYIHSNNAPLYVLNKNIYYIGVGYSPRDPRNQHAVVMKDNKIIHDPYPNLDANYYSVCGGHMIAAYLIVKL